LIQGKIERKKKEKKKEREEICQSHQTHTTAPPTHATAPPDPRRML